MLYKRHRCRTDIGQQHSDRHDSSNNSRRG
jgi:hypothetical protein